MRTETTIPSGLRRLTPCMLDVRDQADAFMGAPKGLGKPFGFLAAFQEAVPYLGLPPQAFELVAWLVKMTRPQDWEEGSRPIAWPSAALQAEVLGLSPARVKVLNRALFAAGIVVMRDSETGKRYGRRGPDGRIVEAYGFDLSPLALRHDEFIRIAAEAKAERERMKALRKRATRARRAIRQIGETLASINAMPPEWPPLAVEAAELVGLIRPARRLDDLAEIVEGLESLNIRGETLVREASESAKTSPSGLENEPHNIATNLDSDPSDYVGPTNEASPSATVEVDPKASLPPPLQDRDTFDEQAQITPGELLELAPNLAAYVATAYPDTRDIIDAAGHLRRDLGISEKLWGESCRKVGRSLAALILAIVSTKPPEHFTRGAGGYFAAMVKRATTGELHLDRSLWKLRRERWSPARSSQNSRLAESFATL